MIWLAIATAVQLLVVLALAVVVLSLARQVGILHERTAPAALSRRVEPVRPGERLPALDVPTLSGESVSFGHAGADSRALTSLLFIAADCPICRSVLPAYHDLLEAHGDSVRGYWAGDGVPLEAFRNYAEAQGIDADRLVLSPELGLRLGVRAVPALAVIDAEQRLVTVDVVDGPTQLGRLFERASKA